MLEGLKWFLSIDLARAVKLKTNFASTLIRGRSNTYSSFRPTSSRKDSANWNKIKAWHKRFPKRAFNVSHTCNGAALWKGVCLWHKATFRNPWPQWASCSASVRDLHACSERSLLQAGTHCSHLLPASWSFNFVSLAFALSLCNTAKSCCVTHCLQQLIFGTTDIWRLDLHGKMDMGTIRLTENLGSVSRPVGDFLRYFAHFLNWSPHTSFYMNNNIYNNNLCTWL